MNQTIPEQPSGATKPAFLHRIGYQIYRTLLGLWKFTVGVVLTQSFLFSFLVAGWTFRVAQRKIALAWWRASATKRENCFCEFVQHTTFHRGVGGWPNWILESNRAWIRTFKDPALRTIRAMFRSLVHSLWLNLKIGMQATFNTCVLTLPGCTLMLFAWYAGWQNSFNKGYENAIIGPATGVAGIFTFIAAMFYVPMAQMRQASTGDWRAFYQFKTVWQLIRKRWLASLGLALLFSALSIPVTVLKTVPQFFPQINSALAELPADKAWEFAKSYYFFSGFVFFGCLLLLRLVAARIYASAVLAALQSGTITEEQLAEREWALLHQLDLLTIKPRRQSHPIIRTVAWCGTKVRRFAVGVAIFLTWFTFTSQVYISEFIMKTERGRGWLNQPLVQLPWFNYIPTALETAAKNGSPVEAPSDWQGKSF